MGNCDPKAIRNGRAWCDVVNKEPLPATPTSKFLAIGKCKLDGSDYQPYDEPVERNVATGTYIWLEK